MGKCRTAVSLGFSLLASGCVAGDVAGATENLEERRLSMSEYDDAEAVCGAGIIDDIDIPVGIRFQTTGNGPANNTRCGV